MQSTIKMVLYDKVPDIDVRRAVRIMKKKELIKKMERELKKGDKKNG